jgi:hypothetical protein
MYEFMQERVKRQWHRQISLEVLALRCVQCTLLRLQQRSCLGSRLLMSLSGTLHFVLFLPLQLLVGRFLTHFTKFRLHIVHAILQVLQALSLRPLLLPVRVARPAWILLPSRVDALDVHASLDLGAD